MLLSKSNIDSFIKDCKKECENIAPGISEKEIRNILTATIEGIALTLGGKYLREFSIPYFGRFKRRKFCYEEILKKAEKSYKEGLITEDMYKMQKETINNYYKRYGKSKD